MFIASAPVLLLNKILTILSITVLVITIFALTHSVMSKIGLHVFISGERKFVNMLIYMPNPCNLAQSN